MNIIGPAKMSGSVVDGENYSVVRLSLLGFYALPGVIKLSTIHNYGRCRFSGTLAICQRATFYSSSGQLRSEGKQNLKRSWLKLRVNLSDVCIESLHGVWI